MASRLLTLYSFYAATLLAACTFEPPPDVRDDAFNVGGMIDGLWEGGQLSVRLQADGIDETKTIDSNGSFEFDATVETGVSFEIAIVEQPVMHNCIATAASGTVGSADALEAQIACTGPVVEIALSTPHPFDFDPSTTSYHLDTTTIAQETSFTVTAADATSIALDSTVPLTSGTPSPYASIDTTHVIDIVVGDLSQTYEFSFAVGGADVEQAAYVKASNTNAGDQFGGAVALSNDVLVVAAKSEDSIATGVNADEANNSASSSGAAYVYRRVDGRWTKEAYLKASNTGEDDIFGESVAISGDLIAIGAPFEDGPTNTVSGGGAVYVYRRVGASWAQEAYLRASNAEAGDNFGYRVALDGDTLAVSAITEDSAATGVNSTQSDNNAAQSGAVYVFRRSGTTWSQEAYIKASNTNANDLFGGALALSGDTLTVATPFEASAATGINGNQSDNSASGAGAVYVFHRSGSVWAQEAYVKASNTDAGDSFGFSVGVSGNRMIVGAPGENSSGTGIDADQENESAMGSGAVYVFEKTGGTWSQVSYVKASNTDGGDNFGWRLAIRGGVFAVSAPLEDSSAIGVDGDQTNDLVTDSGAIYLFRDDGTSLRQVAYVKASNSEAADKAGEWVTMSGDGVAFGSIGEDSAASMVDGDESSNASAGSGAVYVVR